MTPAQEKGATDTMQFPFDVVQWSQLPSDPGKVNMLLITGQRHHQISQKKCWTKSIFLPCPNSKNEQTLGANKPVEFDVVH